jgi:hypothetical protein
VVYDISPLSRVKFNSLEWRNIVTHDVVPLWFQANQFLLLLISAVRLAENQQIPILFILY